MTLFVALVPAARHGRLPPLADPGLDRRAPQPARRHGRAWCGTERPRDVPASGSRARRPRARRSRRDASLPTASSSAGQDLQADESSLTGEAFPVAQAAALRRCPAGAEAPWSRTSRGASRGRGCSRARPGCASCSPAARRSTDEIVRSATRGSREPHAAPARGRPVWSRPSSAAAAALCLILGFVRLRQGYGWLDALVSAVTLAVAALPEEFPVAFTLLPRRRRLSPGAAAGARAARGVRREHRARHVHLLGQDGHDHRRAPAGLRSRCPRRGTTSCASSALAAARLPAGDRRSARRRRPRPRRAERAPWRRDASPPFLSPRTGGAQTAGRARRRMASSSPRPRARRKSCSGCAARATTESGVVERRRVASLAEGGPQGHRLCLAPARRGGMAGRRAGARLPVRRPPRLRGRRPRRRAGGRARAASEAGIHTIMVTGDHPAHGARRSPARSASDTGEPARGHGRGAGPRDRERRAWTSARSTSSPAPSRRRS